MSGLGMDVFQWASKQQIDAMTTSRAAVKRAGSTRKPSDMDAVEIQLFNSKNSSVAQKNLILSNMASVRGSSLTPTQEAANRMLTMARQLLQLVQSAGEETKTTAERDELQAGADALVMRMKADVNMITNPGGYKLLSGVVRDIPTTAATFITDAQADTGMMQARTVTTANTELQALLLASTDYTITYAQLGLMDTIAVAVNDTANGGSGAVADYYEQVMRLIDTGHIDARAETNIKDAITVQAIGAKLHQAVVDAKAYAGGATTNAHARFAACLLGRAIPASVNATTPANQTGIAAPTGAVLTRAEAIREWITDTDELRILQALDDGIGMPGNDFAAAAHATKLAVAADTLPIINKIGAFQRLSVTLTNLTAAHADGILNVEVADIAAAASNLVLGTACQATINDLVFDSFQDVYDLNTPVSVTIGTNTTYNKIVLDLDNLTPNYLGIDGSDIVDATGTKAQAFQTDVIDAITRISAAVTKMAITDSQFTDTSRQVKDIADTGAGEIADMVKARVTEAAGVMASSKAYASLTAALSMLASLLDRKVADNAAQIASS